MPTITKFEDLEIWKEARRLTKSIFLISSNTELSKDFRFKDQIRAAGGSVMDNIAEGFERSGTIEFRQFLAIAKGSAGEVRSQLYRAFDFGYIDQKVFEELKNDFEKLSGKINNFITYLNKQNYRGKKFQAEKP